jgi:glycosyltransferase involved in cell wall biosynthesis
MFYFIPISYDTVAFAAINRCKAYINGFSELGIDTTVICYGDDKKYAEYKLSRVKYSVFRNPFTNKWLSYISQLFYVIWLLLKLKKGDVVFCYGSAWLWYQIIKWKKGVKVYVEYTEKPEIVGIGGKFLTPSYNSFYKACAKLDGLIVISTALREWFVTQGVDINKINIINVIVDSSRFEGIKKQPSERYIAYCGTASNNKDGVDQLIKAFALVANRHPDVKLYIIGKTPDNSQAFDNAQLVDQLGLTDRVIFTGPVDMDLMPQIIINAEVCALARPNNEQARYGFATKMGEYLLSGNPVVVTKVGDFPLFLKDGESALLADADNINSFAEKLDWCLTNIEEAKIIGEKGKQIACKHFNNITETKKLVSALGFDYSA